MGANLNTITFAGDLTEAQVKEKFTAEQEQDRFENGHSYSGGFGMLTGVDFVKKGTIFKSISAAEDYISENQEKWGAAFAVKAMAVPFFDEASPIFGAKAKKTYAQITQHRAELWELKAMRYAPKNPQKIGHTVCPNCKSKISEVYLQQFHCPVCREVDAFLPKKTKNRKKKLEELVETLSKAHEAQVELDIEKAVNQNKIKPVWVVGGWCAS